MMVMVVVVVIRAMVIRVIVIRFGSNEVCSNEGLLFLHLGLQSPNTFPKRYIVVPVLMLNC
jgi:hypothetical protein